MRRFVKPEITIATITTVDNAVENYVDNPCITPLITPGLSTPGGEAASERGYPPGFTGDMGKFSTVMHG
jgi:hypothetical protein